MSMMLFYLFLSLALSFLCSILEAVLLSTTSTFIELKSKESEAGEVLKFVKKDLDKSISAILTINTFAHTIGAAGVGAEATKLFGEAYMVAISIILTLLILYLSEILPKTIGATHWRKLAIPSAYVIRAMVYVTYPLIFISLYITKLFSKNRKENEITREEILALSELGERNGAIREKELDLIENLLNLKDYKVRDILTPRSVIFALQKDITIKEAIDIPDLNSHSRLPVYDKNLDDSIGFVFSHKILESKIRGEDDLKIESLVVPIFKISENIPVAKVLDMFIQRKEHMFLVVDKFGQTEGVVTLEDAIETLLGVEIMDEFDKVEDMQTFAKMKMRSQLKD